MTEVVAVDRAPHRVGSEEVEINGVRARARQFRALLDTTGECADAVAAPEQERNHTPSDHSRRPGDKNAHAAGSPRCRFGTVLGRSTRRPTIRSLPAGVSSIPFNAACAQS